MREVFTVAQARAAGITRAALRSGVRRGDWSPVERGVYVVGGEEPSAVERAVGAVLATGGVASGALPGTLLGIDSARLRPPYVTVPTTGNGRRPGVRRQGLPCDRITTVHGIPCTVVLQTLVDLAAAVDDITWEQMLESALRKKLTTIEELQAEASAMARSRTPGSRRIRRVLGLRPAGAPPTESLLETLMVQLARAVPEVGDFVRQHVVRDEHDTFIARLDLCRPDLGFFIELDGQQHKGQPVYDAVRETAVVGTTGW